MVSCPVRAVHDSQNRLESGERILRDLRLGVRDAPEQRGLSGVRESRQRSVDDQLQVQDDLHLVAREPGFGEAWSLPCRRRELRIPATALAAARCDEARLGVGEVGDQPALRVEDLGSHGNSGLDRLSIRAVLSAAQAVAAFACAQSPHAAERREVAERGICNEDDVAAAASVSAVGSAARHVLLSAKAEPAVAALPGFDVKRRPVVEHATSLETRRERAG